MLLHVKPEQASEERAVGGKQEQNRSKNRRKTDRDRDRQKVSGLGSCKRAIWDQPSSLLKRGGDRRGWVGRWLGGEERKAAGSIPDVARGKFKHLFPLVLDYKFIVKLALQCFNPEMRFQLARAGSSPHPS